MTRLPISLVVISKNEAANIERCLKSVPFAQELLVLDSGSTDNTQEIARGLGAKVFDEAFRGFREQKQRATELASQDWVLNLDADEALSPALAQEIQALFQGGPTANAYSMPRLSFHLGRWIRHGGWYPDRQIRLFDRRVSRWEKGHVHEKISAPIVGELQGDLLHYVFTDLFDQVETNNRYSTLGAKDLTARGRKFYLPFLLMKPIGKFIECYLIKAGYRDGLPGLIIAVGAAYSMFLKYAKLWELQAKALSRDASN